MRRTPLLVLSAVTTVAALGLCGCGGAPVTSEPPIARTTTLSTSPLPAMDVLTDVVYRLADPSIPAEQKVSLLQYGTVDDVPVLRNFGEALAANGYTPLTVQAADLAWAAQPGNVVAQVSIGSADPVVTAFTFPMEFAPARGGWQLTRRSADQLLPLVASPTPTPPG